MRARDRRDHEGSNTATTIAANSVVSQGALVSTPVTFPPSVKVTDANGRPMAGTTVTFAVTVGGGSASGTSVVTNNAGVATVGRWTVGSGVGTDNNTMTATAAGLTGSPVSFTASGAPVANPPSKLGVVIQPSASAVNAVVFSVQPAIQILDVNSLALGVAGITVTAALAPGAGTLGGTTTAVTDVNGLATFANLIITGLVGARALTFTATGLVSVSSSNITVTAGAATTIAFGSPSSITGTVSQNVSLPPVAFVTDVSGNPVSGITVNISGHNGSSVHGDPFVTTASGLTNTASWTLGATAGSQTCTATVAGLTGSPLTFTATALAAAANHLSITTQPSATGTSGASLAQVPAIQLRDPNNNAVNTANVVVTVTVASGMATSFSPATATTDASGVATFTALALTGLVGARTLLFSASSLVGITSTTVTVSTAGAAATIAAVSATSQSAQVSTNVSQPPSVLVTDASGNPVSGTVVTFAVTVGGGTRSPATVTSGANGVATLTSWTLGPSTGANTLTATASGLTGSPVSFSATGTSVGNPATNLTITTQPSSGPTNGTAFAQQPAIQVRDGNGNAVNVAGTVVTVALASGQGTLGGTLTATTDASGVATFGTPSGLKLTGLVGARTLVFTSAGLISVTSTSVTLVASAATTIAANSATSQNATVSANVGAPPSAKITDQSGNPVAGTTVTFAVTAGGGSETPSTVVSNASGIATVTSWTAGAIVGTNNNTLEASSGSLTGSPVVFAASGVPASPVFDQEPASYTTYSDRDFSALTGQGWINPNGTGQLSIQSDATAPYSPPSVGRALYPAASTYAGSGTMFHEYLFPSATRPRDLYMCFWLKLSANFEGGPASGVNKLVWACPTGYEQGRYPFCLVGVGAGTLQAQVRMQNMGVTTSRGISWNATPNVAGIGSAALFTRDVWYKVQTHYIMNTPGVADGAIRVWVNSTKIIEYTTNVGVCGAAEDPHFYNVKVNNTWGGGSGGPGAQQPIADCWVDFDHIHTSGAP